MADEKIGVPFREKATSVGLPSDSRILNRKPMSVAPVGIDRAPTFHCTVTVESSPPPLVMSRMPKDTEAELLTGAEELSSSGCGRRW
jgi:hypothetical protein